MSITDASRLVEIEAEICTIAGVLTTSRARLLALVGEFDAADAWVATGHPSCARWLAALLDIELCTAREQVRAARALRDLPEVRARFASGAWPQATRPRARPACAQN